MNEKQIQAKQSSVSEEEIDLLSLAKTIWHGRKTVILSVLAGAFLGLIVALLSPKEYKATTVLVPQVGNDNQSKLSGLGGLAALAGINIDMNQSSELSPLVYPQIVSSTPFQLELMNTPLNFQDYPKPITLIDYFTVYSKPSVLGTVKKYTLGLPGVIIKAIKGKSKEIKLPADSAKLPIVLTENQVIVQKALDGMVTLDLNQKEGYVTLTAQMPEALVAAQVAQKAQNLLQRYITEFKIKKVKANLNFIQQRYNETKSEFEKAQVSLAIAGDRNKNLTSGLSQIESDRIQTQYTISLGVFQELAKQLEQAKIQVKKETPVLTIIEPVTVPSERSKPNKVLILAIWVFLGGVVGLGLIFGKKYLSGIKEKWNEVN